MVEHEEWISVAEAARRTKRSPRWIQRLAQSGRIVSKPFGEKSIQVNWPSIQRFYEEHPPRRRGEA